MLFLNIYYAAGPVGPCGIVKFNTKSGAVPVIVAEASAELNVGSREYELINID